MTKNVLAEAEIHLKPNWKKDFAIEEKVIFPTKRGSQGQYWRQFDAK